MEDVLDRPITAVAVKYAGFWPRLGAMMLDGLILAPITVGLNFFNILNWKSTGILVAINLLGLVYKPFMEASKGATFGKMALNLRVVNEDLEQASLGEVLLRNIFHIGGLLITLFFTIIMFSDTGFSEITGFMQYSQYTQQFKANQYVTYLVGLITIIDGIVMIADNRNRSLHDKIAKTLVIESKS
jgi:uncharacterized RDD family membrane protein YckC